MLSNSVDSSGASGQIMGTLALLEHGQGLGTFLLSALCIAAQVGEEPLPDGRAGGLTQAEPAAWGPHSGPCLQLGRWRAWGEAEGGPRPGATYLFYKVTYSPSRICHPPLCFSRRGTRGKGEELIQAGRYRHHLSVPRAGLRSQGAGEGVCVKGRRGEEMKDGRCLTPALAAPSNSQEAQ